MSLRTRSSVKPLVIAVLFLGLVVRFSVSVYLGDAANPVSGAADEVSYDTLAQRVVAGSGFTFSTQWYPFTPPNTPTAHWSYLYTLYLAGVYALAGHHPLVARFLQSLLSGLGIWLAYRIGRRLFGDWVGLAAATLSAGYAYLIFFNAALMTQTFYILALLMAIDRALALAHSASDVTSRASRITNWLVLGLALGIGALARQTLLLFAPILLLWLAGTLRGRVRWRYLLIPVATIAMLVLPWTLYNYFTFHDFLLLNSNSGFWFYSSNHPSQGTNFDPNYVAPLPDSGRGLSEPAEDRLLLREGIGFIAADPVRFALLSINRTKDYFWLVPSDQSSIISNVSRLFSFTLYLPFMLFGLWLSRRRWRVCLPLYLYVAFDTGLSLMSWAAPRYRLPSDALLIVFAGLAVVNLAELLKRSIHVPATQQ